MGTCGHDIPCETQFLMVEVPCTSHSVQANDGEELSKSVYYAVFLPILEGDFRAVLQGNAHDELEICLESGTLIFCFFSIVNYVKLGFQLLPKLLKL